MCQRPPRKRGRDSSSDGTAFGEGAHPDLAMSASGDNRDQRNAFADCCGSQPFHAPVRDVVHLDRSRPSPHSHAWLVQLAGTGRQFSEPVVGKEEVEPPAPTVAVNFSFARYRRQHVVVHVTLLGFCNAMHCLQLFPRHYFTRAGRRTSGDLQDLRPYSAGPVVLLRFRRGLWHPISLPVRSARRDHRRRPGHHR